jgi:hypothetical protein
MLIKVRAKTRMPLLNGSAVAEVATILRKLGWLLGHLCLVDYDDDKEILSDVVLTDQCLQDLVQRSINDSDDAVKRWALFPQAPRDPRKLGELFFKGREGLKEVHFSFDECGLVARAGQTHFGNSLSLVWEDRRRGTHLGEVCLAVMEQVFDNSLFDYGFCCISEQYEEKNMDYSGGGARAVGLDVSKALPGLYWGNYFGEHLCQLIGYETLMELPGYSSHHVRSGIIVANELPPDEWRQDNFLANEKATIGRIGSRFFFEKGKDHATVLCWSTSPPSS